MNIEYFEYYYLYSTSSNISNDSVIKFTLNFHRIYPWLLFPFGFIGSLLTILIFTRKKFQKYGCSILFVAESVMVNKEKKIFLFFHFCKYTKTNLGFNIDYNKLYSSYYTLYISIKIFTTFNIYLSII